jgi:hypothetical protein
MFRHLALLAIAAAALTALAPRLAAKECTCRYYNQRVEIGAVACVNGKLAKCLMFQNNPSWKFVSDACPQSRNETRPLKHGAKAKFAAH